MCDMQRQDNQTHSFRQTTCAAWTNYAVGFLLMLLIPGCSSPEVSTPRRSPPEIYVFDKLNLEIPVIDKKSMLADYVGRIVVLKQNIELIEQKHNGILLVNTRFKDDASLGEFVAFGILGYNTLDPFVNTTDQSRRQQRSLRNRQSGSVGPIDLPQLYKLYDLRTLEIATAMSVEEFKEFQLREGLNLARGEESKTISH